MSVDVFLKALDDSTENHDPSIDIFLDSDFYIVGANDPESGHAVPYARMWENADSKKEEGVAITAANSVEHVMQMGEFLIPIRMNGRELLAWLDTYPQWSVMMLGSSGGGIRLMPEHLSYYRSGL